MTNQCYLCGKVFETSLGLRWHLANLESECIPYLDVPTKGISYSLSKNGMGVFDTAKTGGRKVNLWVVQ